MSETNFELVTLRMNLTLTHKAATQMNFCTCRDMKLAGHKELRANFF